MKSRAADWLKQAEDDFKWAQSSLFGSHWSQTCFICQQAGEKARKSIAFFRGADLVKSLSLVDIATVLEYAKAFLLRARSEPEVTWAMI